MAYGFQQFTSTHSPGYFNANGNGGYAKKTVSVKLAARPASVPSVNTPEG